MYFAVLLLRLAARRLLVVVGLVVFRRLLRLIETLQSGRVRIERDDADPALVTATFRDDSFLHETPHGDQIVLATGGDQSTVGTPADAQETAEVAAHTTDQLHGVVVEHP